MKYKKGLIYKEGFIIFLLILSGCLAVSRASALGVSPAIYKVNFEPGLEKTFYFRFHSDDPTVEFETYTAGDLAQYVELEKSGESGSGEVNAILRLPQVIEKPGMHRIIVGALQKSKGDAMLGIVANVQAVIDIYVPYPGKYAEIEFDIKNVNVGEDIPYNLRIYSRGNENLVANSIMEIFDSQNKSAGTVQLGSKLIEPTKYIDIVGNIDGKNYGAGDYRAVAVVSYEGKEVKSERSFKIGELNVKIINFTRELKKNTINPFKIEVESAWNDNIENLFGEVFVKGTDISFKTPSVELKAWETAELLGYFDTREIREDGFEVRIVVYYNDKVSEETAYLKFIKSKNSYLLIGSIIFGIIALLSFALYILLRLRRLEQKNDKAKK